MDDKLKESIKRSQAEVDQIQEKLGDLVEDLPEEMEEVRDRVLASLKHISEKLADSKENAENLTEEAQLQAHLGAMEAQDKMEASRKVFDEYLAHATSQGKTLMDEIELKANLAKMEAEDFWEKRGPELTDEFNKSRDAMMKIAGSAMEEMQGQFKKWNDLFSKK